MYLQVSSALGTAIADGTLQPGDRLQNEIALAERLSLSRPTVRRAIQELVDRGLLVRKRGVGTQVVNGPVSRELELFSLHDDLARAGLEPTTAVLTNVVMPAPVEVAGRLGLEPQAPVTKLRRIRMSGGEPLAILHNYIPCSVIELMSADLRRNGLYPLLRGAGISVKVARQRIGARLGSDEECRLLKEPAHTTVLTVDRVAIDDFGRPGRMGPARLPVQPVQRLGHPDLIPGVRVTAGARGVRVRGYPAGVV